MTRKIKIAGFGGQGVMLTGQMIAYAANLQGLNCVWVPTYGPETRGGTANCSVVVSNQPIYSPIFKKADDLLIFNLPSLHKFIDQVEDDGNLIYNSSLIQDEVKGPKNIYGVPMNDLANELSTPQVANMIMLGAFLKVTGIFTEETIDKSLEFFFSNGKERFLPVNRQAVAIGHEYVQL